MAKRTRKPETYLLATARLYLAHIPEQNARVVTACQQQGPVHKRQTTENQLRAGRARKRKHTRRHWANRLCRRHNTICAEDLATRNMTRSAKGTSESPGTNVKQKTGLNRSLLGIAPREQTDILLRVGERTGTRIEPVNPRNSSRECNACGYTHEKNRKSQARFECRSCRHTDNADANAGKNLLDRGIRQIRARMDASGRTAGDGAPPKEPTQAGKTGGQEQPLARSRARPAREGTYQGGVRGSTTPATITRTQESWRDRTTQESWPDGQIS